MKRRNKIIDRVIRTPFLVIIWIYQKLISVFLPPSCIYWPSCSEYSKQAFIKHGPIGGLYLSVRRILRCHPFHEGGIDEVPETIPFFTLTKNG